MQTNDSARRELFLYLCVKRILSGGQPRAEKKK
jgi:hypothetical protein